MKASDLKFYIQQLRGEECQCGNWKKSKMSLCYTCYRSLPRDMQKALYNHISTGYAEAYDAAVQFLNEG